jgi:ABC-2 type transport system permease protein
VQFLPLKYLAYFPAAVFLGKVPSDELAFEMTMLVGWTAVFIVLSRVLYAAGLRRYSGYGG